MGKRNPQSQAWSLILEPGVEFLPALRRTNSRHEKSLMGGTMEREVNSGVELSRSLAF